MLLFLFFAGPIIWAVLHRLHQQGPDRGRGAKPEMGRLCQFHPHVQRPRCSSTLWSSRIFVVGSAVIGQNTLGFLIALLERGKNTVVTATLNTFIIAAWVMPEIVAAFCWYAYLYQGGTLDSFLHHFGLSQDWLYTTPMLAVIIANVWRGTAFSMLVYSAAMSDLPPDLLEAAEVDGASQLSLLRRVIIPLLRRP